MTNQPLAPLGENRIGMEITMGDQAAHALFSPSSGHKWIRCAGSLAMEDGLPDSTADYADEGTAAHELASWSLTDGRHQVSAYEGRIIQVVNGKVWPGGDAPRPPKLRGQKKDIERQFEVDDDMIEFVQTYVDNVLARVEEYKLAGAVEVYLHIENRVDLSGVLNIPNQFGTSDVIILVEWADGTWLIDVEDLKYGYRMVYADHNEQLMLYALAALDQYGIVGNFTRARMVIHQPRREHISDWECSVDELIAFGKQAKIAAHTAHALIEVKRTGGEAAVLPHLIPGEKQCQWCKRNGNCPALGKWAEEIVGAEFDDLTKENVLQSLDQTRGESDPDYGARLGRLLRAMPLLEIFSKGILTAAESFMFNGGEIDGFKVVAGKKGKRSWGVHKDDAEAAMKAMRLRQEEMYSFKLISPTQAEKLLAKQSPRRWKTLQDFIVQKEGQPSIADAADSREPLVIQKPEDDFGVVTDGHDSV